MSAWFLDRELSTYKAIDWQWKLCFVTVCVRGGFSQIWLRKCVYVYVCVSVYLYVDNHVASHDASIA